MTTRWLRQIAAASIWHPDAIPASEGEVARDMKRWALPTIDAILIAGSFAGLLGGLPSVAIIYNPAISHAAALAVLGFSIAAAFGVSFPRLWVVEMGGKCGLAFVLLLYALLLVVLATNETAQRGWVAGVTAACAVVPIWRIVWLGREHRRRRAARAAR